jgi:hypothetical protein
MNEPAQIAFGIDLAGYSSGKSVCAVAEQGDEHVAVTILSGSPLSDRHRGDEEIGPIVAREAAFLRSLLSHAVAVDIPIDLQDLLTPKPLQVWQLTKRPVDHALGALCPLADRVGSPTARFRNILAVGGLRGALGDRLFETYPAGSLRMLQLPYRGYKNGSIEAEATLRALMVSLHVSPGGLTHDEFDATLCAIAALPEYRLTGIALSKALSVPLTQMPNGYLLLKRPPSCVTVARQSVSEWGAGKLQ